MENLTNLKSSNKLRVVGKIRGFTEDELKSVDQDSKLWITVKNPQSNGTSEKSKVSFDSKSTSRKDVYELDFCYEQNDEIGLIYLREVKPLISEVFKGQNASFIALGAKGSGKTYTIQGSQEKPGLALMAMADILSIARELGKSVSVSIYELTHDHAYDLLDPKHPEVQVMEDAHGKINLKGLSQTPVKSISDFHTIYFSNSSFQKTQKELMNVPHNHKGLMVHISTDDKQKTKLANKINFVDLTGYEDPKKSIKDGKKLAEINRTNKSLYALLNVISSLKANEIRLPYRESKLTRILQDSLGCKSHLLLLACLKPFFCQDTISSMSLVSRSYRSSKQLFTYSTNRNQSTNKVKDLSSSKGGRATSALLSAKNNSVCSDRLVEKKASSILNKRKFFNKEKKINSKEAPPAKSIFEGSSPIESKEDKNLEGAIDEKAIIIAQEDVPPHITIEHPEATHNISLNAEAPAPCEATTTCEENTTSQKINKSSPPISERIREISNKLKSLCSSTPLRIKMLEEVVVPQYNIQAGRIDALEPKTPVMELGSAKEYSPRSTFGNRSEGVKQSLVQEYLHFLNSASKEQLKGLKGIGEKRATYILELREESPEPFKNLDDLQDIGLSAKQIKGMMKKAAGELFN